MGDKTLSVDIQRILDNLNESIKENREYTNRIWHGILRLITALSSSLLVVTIAVVEKIFQSSIPSTLIISWILFFISIIFAVISEINMAIFFSNRALCDAKEKLKYEKLLCKEEKIPYSPPDNTGFIYDDIKWGVIAINSFFFAVLFMCAALLGKVLSNVWIYLAVTVATILVLIADVYFVRKRKTA